MDSKLILEAARGTLDGSLSFPDVVGKLLAAGVEYYHVDYVGLRKRFYSAEGGMMATSINYEDLPPVAPATSTRNGSRGQNLKNLERRQGCVAATSDQTFPAHITLEGFGGGGFRHRHIK
jgi:hypothetical protein